MAGHYDGRAIYNDAGYVDVPGILALGLPFNLFQFPRGTGKTYGAIQMIYEHAFTGKFMWVRRTGVQLDACATAELNPFNEWNQRTKSNINFLKIPGLKFSAYNIAEAGVDDKGRLVQTGETLGLGVPILSITNMRGFQTADYTHIFFDEYIPELHEKRVRGEGRAVVSMYETVNRNRELMGKPPVQFAAFGNTDMLDAPLHLELGVVRIIADMKRKKKELYIDEDRGLLICNGEYSPVAKAKRDTALYKLLGDDSDYLQMAIANKYAVEGEEYIRPRNLKNYQLITTVGEISIYRSRSDDDIYVSPHEKGVPYIRYGSDDRDIERFRRQHAYLWTDYMLRRVTFEDAVCAICFTRYFHP